MTVREKAKGMPEVVPALKLGDTVRIRGCQEKPELDGAEGLVVQMQTQEHETYATRPVWVKMTSGEGAGRVCGFLETELEV